MTKSGGKIEDKDGAPKKSTNSKALEKLLKQLNAVSVSSSSVQKDMADYKFWRTQPVAAFGDPPVSADGPIQPALPVEQVPKEPMPLPKDFEWVTMNVEDPLQLQELYKLLSEHYVEDIESMFRFDYSASFLEWALKAPGWFKSWHVGVRVKETQKLVAFISAIPVVFRIRDAISHGSEVNFLCVYKKLRSKRLAPVMIKEITRRCHLEGIWQALYTSGTILPTPISTCRYYHRSLNWKKLYEAGFSGLNEHSTVAQQIKKYELPSRTSLSGLREMKVEDVGQVSHLLTKYLARFEIAPLLTDAEIEHWFVSSVHEDRVVWAYVVEDSDREITDFVSFYSLPSSVLNNKTHTDIRAAYLFYYASDAAFGNEDDQKLPSQIRMQNKSKLQPRLNELMHDTLILAKSLNFDVFNSLTILDNPLFIDEQKFAIGDGRLHYYVYNYKAKPIEGGSLTNGDLNKNGGSEVGLVML